MLPPTSIYLVTYNVAGHNPSSTKDYSGLFDQDLRHDVYVITFQEVTKRAVVKNLARKALSANQFTKILARIFLRHGFVLLKRHQITFTAMWIFVRKEQRGEFVQVQVILVGELRILEKNMLQARLLIHLLLIYRNHRSHSLLTSHSDRTKKCSMTSPGNGSE